MLKILARALGQESEMKEIPEKKKIQITKICKCDMILFLKDLEGYARNLISNSTFSKLTGYKDLLNKDENSEEEIIHDNLKDKKFLGNKRLVKCEVKETNLRH